MKPSYDLGTRDAFIMDLSSSVKTPCASASFASGGKVGRERGTLVYDGYVQVSLES